MKITAIRLERMRLPLVPPFRAAWDPVPRQAFDATLVRVESDEGVTGYGSGDSMDGFAAYEDLFLGRDPARIARHVRTLETIGFHASRYWPLEAALWDITGKVAGLPVAALLGGAVTSLPAYASFGESKSPAQRAEAVLAAREAGFRAVKIRIDRTDMATGLADVAFALGAGDTAAGQAGNADAAIGAVTALRDRVGLTGTLAGFGVGATDYAQIAADALDDEVLDNTPRMPDAAGIAAILTAAQGEPAALE